MGVSRQQGLQASVMKKLAEVTLAAPASTIDITSIPFADIFEIYIATGPTTDGANNISFTLNADAGARYNYCKNFSTSKWNQSNWIVGTVGLSDPAGITGGHITIFNRQLYNKSIQALWSSVNSENTFTAGGWNNTVDAVSRFTLACSAGNFATGSKAVVMGITL